MSLRLKVVTPEKQIIDEEVDQVNVTSSEGELGILPHHVNLMAKLMPGELRVKKGGRIQTMATGDGFLQMANNTLTIMTDLAVDAVEINEHEVEEAKKRAEKALAEKLTSEEYAATIAIIEKMGAQLRVKRRHHGRGGVQ